MDASFESLIGVNVTDGDARLEVSSAELVTRIQAIHPECFGWALHCCDNQRQDAEDVLQDVYVGVLDNGLQFQGLSSLKTWLFGVIRQKAMSRRRKERLRELLGIRNVARIDTPSPAPDADARAMAGDKREATRRALAQLPQRQREVLLLVFYHDLTIEQSAMAMNVSVGSARQHYDRGKKRLATMLNGKRP